MNQFNAIQQDDAAGEQASHQLLTFELSGERYGVDIADVREIIPRGKLTPVPLMPAFMAGVINLRGSVLPVMRLAERLGLEMSPRSKRTSIVIVDTRLEEDGASDVIQIGMMVDAVNDVAEVLAADIRPAPELGARIRVDFIAGMARREDGFLIILEPARVLSVAELTALVGSAEGQV